MKCNTTRKVIKISLLYISIASRKYVNDGEIGPHCNIRPVLYLYDENSFPDKQHLYIMMTSSNGNIFRVTGHLYGEFTGPPVNYPHKGQWRVALMFSLICVWINGWVNNREAGDLRRYRAHYDVTVMSRSPRSYYLGFYWQCFWRWNINLILQASIINHCGGMLRYINWPPPLIAYKVTPFINILPSALNIFWTIIIFATLLRQRSLKNIEIFFLCIYNYFLYKRYHYCDGLWREPPPPLFTNTD